MSDGGVSAISLFSGVGGLDIAVAEVFDAHPVAFAECDPNAAKVLAARWPAVPNEGDVTTVAWDDWTGVDVLHGGPPCQPTSSAGKRLGEADERWMWPAALDALRRVRPRWVVWENPSALLGLGDGEPFGRILGEMAEAGYVGSYGCLRASDIGACHRRERLFIVAADAERAERWPGHERAGRTSEGQHGAREAPSRPRIGGPFLADADGGLHGDERRGLLGPEGSERGRSDDQRPRAGGAAVADADRGRLQERPQLDSDTTRLAAVWHPCGGHADGRRDVPAGRGGVQWGDYAPAVARHAAVLGRPAPAPVDERGRLSARFVEWMQMFPEGWVTDVLPRNPALKALGNAVVPAQGAAALRMLLSRVGERVAA